MTDNLRCPQPTEADHAADRWAVVELMGRTKLAGRVTEQPFAGGSLVRIDVPEVTHTRIVVRNGGHAESTRTIPAHTASVHMQAIYAIHWTDRQTAELAAHQLPHEPISPYALAQVLDGMDAAGLARMLGGLQTITAQAAPHGQNA